MGGHAFASGPEPLQTPRMPPEVYHFVRDWAQTKLRELFIAVAAPIDGPAKDDFGDIDVLVTQEKMVLSPNDILRKIYEEAGGNVFTAIQHWLGAKAMKKDKGQPVGNYAVRWPAHLLPISKHETEVGHSAFDNNMSVKIGGKDSDFNQKQDLYIQIDVTIHPTLDTLCYRLFKHGHGDLWNILGSAIRPLGLLVDEGSLWLRHPDIERFHKARSKVHLSSDPIAILSFLGLRFDGSVWEQPFNSVDELYSYVTSCKYFYIWPPRDDHDSDDNTLPATDRRKAKERPVVARYFNTFLPSARERGLFTPPADCPTIQDLRALVRRDAFAFFPGSEAVYTRTGTDWATDQDALRVWNDGIRAVVPPSVADDVKLEPGQCFVKGDDGRVVALLKMYRGVTTKALKKVVNDAEGACERHGVARGDVECLRDERGVLLLEEVKGFVERNWEKVGSVAWPEHQEKAAEHMKIKNEKEEQKKRKLGEESGDKDDSLGGLA